MAVQHTDTNFHNLDFFADSYEDIDVSSSAEFTSKAKETDICTFNGDFDIQDTDKSIKYYLMQGDKIKDTKQVDITKSGKNGIDGTDGEKGDTGITVTIEPNSLDLTPDRSGAVADEVTTRFDINAYQNSSLVEISGVTLINEIPKDEEDNPYYEVTIDLDSGKNARIALTVKKGFMFDSPTDTIYKLNFLVVTNTGDSIETAYILKKVSKGTSLGRINYVPSGRELQNVCYDTDEFNSDGSVKTICVETVYAFIGDLVVNVGSGDEDSIVCDVYRFNGSDWVLVNNDVNACYAAFEDIMSVTESDSAVVQVICKRLVAQTALINNLVAKFVKIKDDGYIRTGAFINPDGSDNDDPQTGGGLLAKGNELKVKGKIIADQLVIGKKIAQDIYDTADKPTSFHAELYSFTSSDDLRPGYFVLNGYRLPFTLLGSSTIFIVLKKDGIGKDISSFYDPVLFKKIFYFAGYNASYLDDLLNENLSDDDFFIALTYGKTHYTEEMREVLKKYGAKTTSPIWDTFTNICNFFVGSKNLGADNGYQVFGDKDYDFVIDGNIDINLKVSVNDLDTHKEVTKTDGASVATVESLIANDIKSYRKIYKICDITTDSSGNRSVVNPPTAAPSTYSGTSGWYTSTKPSITDSQILFSCTQWLTYNNTYGCTKPSVDAESVIDTENGYIKINLVDTDTLFAKDIVMKSVGGSYGKIESYGFNADEKNGFRIDAQNKRMYINELFSGGIIKGYEFDGYIAKDDGKYFYNPSTDNGKGFGLIDSATSGKSSLIMNYIYAESINPRRNRNFLTFGGQRHLFGGHICCKGAQRYRFTNKSYSSILDTMYNICEEYQAMGYGTIEGKRYEDGNVTTFSDIFNAMSIAKNYNSYSYFLTLISLQNGTINIGILSGGSFNIWLGDTKSTGTEFTITMLMS